MPVLDTNFLIRLEAGDAIATKALGRLQDTRLVVPAQAAGEYLVRSQQPEIDLTRLRAAFHVVHTTDDHLLVVARLARQAFDQRGTPRVRWGDLHIAAVAVLERTYVVTANKRHFAALGVDAWHFEHEPEPPAGG